MVIARTAGGDIAFMTGHAPFLGTLGIGEVRIHLTDGGEERAAVHGGFVEVFDNRVIILSDVAELASQIDVARARAAEERAQRSASGDGEDEQREAALRRARVRLEVARAS